MMSLRDVSGSACHMLSSQSSKTSQSEIVKLSHLQRHKIMFVKNAARYCNQTSSVLILMAVITTFVVSSIYLTRFWLKRHTPIKGFELDHSWDYRKYHDKGLLVPVKDADGQPIYVSNSTLGRLSTVRLDFQNSSKEACEVELHVPNQLIRDRRIFGLGNGKIVVLVRYDLIYLLKRSTKMTADTNWLLSVINPTTCTSDDLDLPYPNSELVDALPYQDEFDLFLKVANRSRDNEQLVLRYRDDSLPKTNFVHRVVLEDNQKLKVIKPYSSEGYYYVARMYGESGLFLEKLNPKFKVNEIHGIHLTGAKPISPVAYSMAHDEISVCSFEVRNETNMRCLIADAEFKEIRLDVVVNLRHGLEDLIIESLGDGGALLVFRWAFSDRSNGVYFLHLRNNGLAHQPVEIVRFFRPITGIYVMEMDGGRYCVNVASESSMITRCILPIS